MGLITSSCIAVFDVFEMPFKDAFLSKEKLLRTLYFILAGIFIVGYSNWTKKVKRENNTELSHDNAVNK
ncbi:hypothetical protein E0I61_02745 [Flavobacterium ranwuense]|uniref:Uncharacterized protein n=1 Tax=Flavobacterium ranwuense TaxID=2541725 RepID=A0ABY2DXH7_9FLAO|nr:hypothetical protein [Flavobacterium ranwuense]TDE31637.1 hypothetical protein E0I61_02745 [Flavobacterium ranwuense]